MVGGWLLVTKVVKLNHHKCVQPSARTLWRSTSYHLPTQMTHWGAYELLIIRCEYQDFSLRVESQAWLYFVVTTLIWKVIIFFCQPMLDLVEIARERLPQIRNGLPALLGPEQALVDKFSWHHLFFTIGLHLNCFRSVLACNATLIGATNHAMLQTLQRGRFLARVDLALFIWQLTGWCR